MTYNTSDCYLTYLSPFKYSEEQTTIKIRQSYTYLIISLRQQSNGQKMISKIDRERELYHEAQQYKKSLIDTEQVLYEQH